MFRIPELISVRNIRCNCGVELRGNPVREGVAEVFGFRCVKCSLVFVFSLELLHFRTYQITHLGSTPAAISPIGGAMPKFFRQLGFLTALLFLCNPRLRVQDMPTRVEAVHLLERANAASLPSSNMPNHKQDVTFRAYELDGTKKDGDFNAIYAKDGDRDEFNFGDYHGIRLTFQGKMLQNAYQQYPTELWK